MEWFIKEVIKWEKFELLIDKNFFSKDIVLKAAYNFLDMWYFFFKYDKEENIILQFTKKPWVETLPEQIIMDFSDELLSVYLRNKLEKENKIIRETIVSSALSNSLDSNNFVEFDTDNNLNNQDQNQIDFDKDIDEILKEIENDPDLKIDEDEIERILKEIEEESEEELQPALDKTKITLDPKAVKNAKEKFQDR